MGQRLRAASCLVIVLLITTLPVAPAVALSSSDQGSGSRELSSGEASDRAIGERAGVTAGEGETAAGHGVAIYPIPSDPEFRADYYFACSASFATSDASSTTTLDRSFDLSSSASIVIAARASRHDDRGALANETRKRIYETIVETPGVHRAKLADEADIPISTVRYHLRVLETEGLVDQERRRGRCRLFPTWIDDTRVVAAMADDVRREMLQTIDRREPVNVSDLASRLDLGPSTASYHLKRLEDDGLVTREREGQSVLTSLAPRVSESVSAIADDD